jgi:hypothetical protein
VEGDELVVHRFETATIGLAAASDMEQRPSPTGFWFWLKGIFETAPAPPRRIPAVCVPPGAKLVLQDVPKHLQREWSVPEQVKVSFTQITANANMHRDALRLPNGREVLLQQLRPGLQVRVVSLGGETNTESLAGSAIRSGEFSATETFRQMFP